MGNRLLRFTCGIRQLDIQNKTFMGVFMPNRMVSTRSGHDVFAPNEIHNPTFRWLQLAVFISDRLSVLRLAMVGVQVCVDGGHARFWYKNCVCSIHLGGRTDDNPGRRRRAFAIA